MVAGRHLERRALRLGWGTVAVAFVVDVEEAIEASRTAFSARARWRICDLGAG